MSTTDARLCPRIARILVLVAVGIGGPGCADDDGARTAGPAGEGAGGGDDGPGGGDGGGGASCQYPAECGAGDCTPAGVCVEAPPCADFLDCPIRYQVCVEGRCITRCDSDDGCVTEGYCHRGECRPFPLPFDGPPAHPAGASAGPLQAGTAVVDVDPPMGMEMAGFGFRDGPVSPLNPYAKSMGGSNGMWDRPNVKVITLDNGAERLAVLRLPTCWSTDYLRTAIVQELLDRGRPNYHGRIVTVSNHTHSYPGQYWRLLSGLGFESFGYGAFSPSWWRHLVERSADAVEAAEDALRPAALAHAIDPQFDPDNLINRDRREQNPPFKDPRMLAVRIDDVSGAEPAPMAVIVEYATHGTVMDNTRLSGDSGGAVEWVAEEALEARHGRPATVIFANGSAGDVSPGGDDLGHRHQARLELLGRRGTAALLRLIDPLTPRRDVVLRQHDRRVPITREALGYAEGEFFKKAADEFDLDAGPFQYGAFQCVQTGDADQATVWTDGELGCLFSVELVNNRAPVPQFSKTVLTALRIGDLVVLTMPGEPVSRLGYDLAESVATRYGLALGDVAVFGYSQDHQLYLTPREDWFQGGYEAAQGVWGFRLGDYLAEHAEEAAGAVLDNAVFDPAPAGIHPVWFEEELPPDFPAPKETPGTPGEVGEDVAEVVRRFDVVRFAWIGGHPGADVPVVTLEREDPGAAGGFAALVWPGVTPYTDRGLRMVVDYLGRWGNKQPDGAPDAQRWSVLWEELGEFPLGRYRLVARGRAMKGGRILDYAATSRVFDVVAATGLPFGAPSWDPAPAAGAPGGTFTGTLAYPPSPDGSFRLRSDVARHPAGGAPAAASVTLVAPAGAEATAEEAGPGVVRLTVRFAAPPAGAAEVSAEDAWGNGWRWAEAPDPGDGEGEGEGEGEGGRE